MSTDPPPKPQLLLLETHPGLGASSVAQLESMGYHLHWTSDLQAFLKLQAELHPQVLIVELERGEVGPSPQDLTQLLQARDEGVPLVLVSVQNDLTARLQAVRSGCDIYLSYPLDLTLLARRLDLLLDPPPHEPERVLVVEDSHIQASYLGNILREAGMEVCLLTDPQLALERLGDFKPDLILMDLYMPRCTGIELAAAIRMDPTFLGIPIVFLSSEMERSTQLEALGQGADDFLTKPIQPQHLVSSVRIRAERTRLIRSLMSRDSLTGLRNHSAMKSRLEEEWNRAQRGQAPFAFAMVDLDHFKQVNDRFGHPFGDQVLQSLSHLFQRRLRRTDLVGRLGGEEFGILFTGTTLKAAFPILDSLRADFAHLDHLSPQGPTRYTFSAGIVSSQGPFGSAAALWEAADKALYQAKAGGRNRVYVG
ncbi:MAG TPA: diguanylate cyclase [Holophagaceae bacterium]|nr:diguanylate cyclase [Holophagaceae bacterium]